MNNKELKAETEVQQSASAEVLTSSQTEVHGWQAIGNKPSG